MAIRLSWRLLRLVFVAYIFMLAILIVPGFVGIRVETVTSGSMEPAIHTGSVIYVKQAEFGAIKTGDIITYVIDDENTKVTHRVMEIDADGQRFWTKGDANRLQDAKPVAVQNVLGTVIYIIPFLGKMAVLLTSMRGKAALVCLLLLFAILDSVINAIIPKRAGAKGE